MLTNWNFYKSKIGILPAVMTENLKFYENQVLEIAHNSINNFGVKSVSGVNAWKSEIINVT